MKTNKLLGCFPILVLAVMLSGCVVKHSQPYYAYAPDMHFAPSLKAQETDAMRPLPGGAIPRGFRPYSIVTMEQAKANLNPVLKSKSNLQQGRHLYTVYCSLCHGKFGEGDGPVAAMPDWPRPLFPRPPTLQSEKVRDLKDGQIFHIITMGQTLMPAYAADLNDEERWLIVHYLRVLYRAKHPTPEDSKQAENYIEEIGE